MTKANIKYYIVAVLAFLILTQDLPAQKRIAGFGSSVCNGTGDELNLGGYIGRFRDIAARHGWEVISVSRGGDNTVTIQDRWEKTTTAPLKPVSDNQYLIPAKPDYIILGLSLANEGIRKDIKSSRDSVFTRFQNGILRIIRQCDSLGIRVVIANCYPHSFYTPDQYDAIKQMNLFINTLPYPGINLLGTIDDGSGHWAEGFYRDEGHPSSGGHREMSFAIVPTLFDALEKGKPQPPQKILQHKNNLNKRFPENTGLVTSISDTMHSFTVSFSMNNLSDGEILSIDALGASADTSVYLYKENTRKGLTVRASDQRLNRMLRIKDGILSYVSGNSILASAGIDQRNTIRLSVTHNTALGETRIYLNDKKIVNVNERLIPEGFSFQNCDKNGTGNILVYRSSLNDDEIDAVCGGALLKSSLEIYSPLDETYGKGDKSIENLAQSESKLVLKQ